LYHWEKPKARRSGGMLVATGIEAREEDSRGRKLE